MPAGQYDQYSKLEAKTLMYWCVQMHWNGREPITKHLGRAPTVQQAISDCNLIMRDLDPNRRLSKLAFDLQGDIITNQRPHYEHGQPLNAMATPIKK